MSKTYNLTSKASPKPSGAAALPKQKPQKLAMGSVTLPANPVAPSVLPPPKSAGNLAAFAHDYRTWAATEAAYGVLTVREMRLKLDELFAKHGV